MFVSFKYKSSQNSPALRSNNLWIWLTFFVFAPMFETRGESEDELGSWYIYNGFFNFNPKFELFFETQLRLWEVTSNPETFFLRPYFNYNIHQNFQTGIGLEYHKNQTFSEDPDEREISEEYRLTLQAMAFQKIGRVSLQHRYRYEFRNISPENGQRMRYRIMATVPINKKALDKKVFFFAAFNELMVETEPTLILSQNRFYLAAGYYFTKDLNFQFGYLFQSRQSNTHHRLQFWLTHRVKLYKD